MAEADRRPLTTAKRDTGMHSLNSIVRVEGRLPATHRACTACFNIYAI